MKKLTAPNNNLKEGLCIKNLALSKNIDYDTRNNKFRKYFTTRSVYK